MDICIGWTDEKEEKSGKIWAKYSYCRSVIDVGFLLPCPAAGSILGQAEAASTLQFARFSHRQMQGVPTPVPRLFRQAGAYYYQTVSMSGRDKTFDNKKINAH
jgi:hypothetical protein